MGWVRPGTSLHVRRAARPAFDACRPRRFRTCSPRISPPPRHLTPLHRDAQVQELTRHNQELVHALDAKERECAELSAALETGGDRLAAGVRESKIVEMARKNRSLTLAVEKEKAEKARLVTELQGGARGHRPAPGGLHAGAERYEDGTPRTGSQIEKACREVVAGGGRISRSAPSGRTRPGRPARMPSAAPAVQHRARGERPSAGDHQARGRGRQGGLHKAREVAGGGGWIGGRARGWRAATKVKRLRDRLEAYEDGVVSVASTVSRFATARTRTNAPSEVGFDAGSRPGTATTDASRRTARASP